MSTTEISMEVVEQYLKQFILLDANKRECNASILRLPIFKKMLFDCCQNPNVEFDEESINKAIANDEYVYGNSDFIMFLARSKAKEIRESELKGVTPLEFFEIKNSLELIKNRLNEINTKLNRINNRLRDTH